MPEKNPMENLLGDDKPTPPATPPPKEPEKNEELDTLKESVNTLGENLQSLDEKLTAIDEKITTAPPPAEETPEEPPFTGPSGQPKDWKEVRETSRKDAEEIVEAKLSEKEKEAEEKYAEEDKRREVMDKEFDRQIAEMEKDGMVQPIKDANDPDDPAINQRREIFGYAGYKMKTTDLRSATEALEQYHKNGMTFDPKTQRFIRQRTSSPGQSVPVGSSSSRGAGGKEPIDYKTLHSNSMDELIRRSME